MCRTRLFIGSALILILSAVAYGQTKTITNADLEKYRQARLAAEKDLRENYKALGFPSPEVLARQEEESRRELSELAQRLRERDRRNAASQRSYYVPRYPQSAPVYPYPNPSFVDYGGQYAPAYLYYRNYSRYGWYPYIYQRYPRSTRSTRRSEPRRFGTLRRMLRNARH